MAAATDRKKIYKNTLLLYIRLFLSVGVSIYTSRIVLQALGVNNFGIYGLVGGVVAMFSFINASMSSATSRFITISLVNPDKSDFRKTFSTAFLVHIIIGIAVVILAEAIGTWFIEQKLNIKPDRLYAAQWVYQLSVISTFIGITQVPYNATLIAKERFDLFAGLDILLTLLKFFAALLILRPLFDVLIYYAILIFLSTLLTRVCSRIICIKLIPDCKLLWKWYKQIGKGMLTFSGWNMFSQFCFVARQQGTNILLNIFGGTAVNAASSLAMTVQSLVDAAATNLVTASRPQIISSYAKQQYSAMFGLLCDTSLLANILYCAVALPFLFEIEGILSLWLVKVPAYTASFCSCIIILSFFSLNNNMLSIGIHADGKIQFYSLVMGSLSVIVVPVVWMLFKSKMSLNWAFIVPILSAAIIYIFSLWYHKRLIESFKIGNYLKRTLGYLVGILAPCIVILYLIRSSFSPSIGRIVFTILTAVGIIGTLSFFMVLSQEVRQKVVSKACFWRK